MELTRIKYTIAAILVLVYFTPRVYSQAVLQADGPGNTYELINSVLAPGYDVVENPECAHSSFGRHIAEVWDADLNQFVFEFYSHVTPDNDRCINFDRQRIEIKTYDQSPNSLKGIVGETVTYKWRFKLPTGFQPSTSFTHIHQIKPVGGDDGDPLFTLTPRKGSPNKLELIHNNTTKVKIVNLSSFEGVWVECTEIVFIDSVNGTYSMTIKKVSDGATLLSYSNSSLMTIRPSNSFIRPKWGIYRSLDHPSDLRDEAVRFSQFFVGENTTTTLPNAPTILNAAAVSTSQINLTWVDNSINEEQFRIERSVDSVSWVLRDLVFANTISYSDTSLSSNTKYYYRVRSENTFGNSSYSNSASATTYSMPIKYTSTGNSTLWTTQIWSPAGSPNANDTVIIAHNLTLDSDITVAYLKIDSGSTLSISANRNFNGNILIKGTFSISGLTTVTMNGNVTCSGSGALLKFSSNGGRINNTGIGKIFTLSNGATFFQSNSTTYSSTPLAYSMSGMNWSVDNSLSLTTVIYNISGNTVVTSIPNSQSFGNLKFTTTTTATTSRTITISENLNILGDLTFAATYNATLNSFTWNFGIYSITTTGAAKSVVVTQTAAHPIIITGTSTSLFNGFSLYNFKPPTNGNCKIIYGSASSQVVVPGSYQFLTISGGGTKSLSGQAIISDSLIFAGGKLILGLYNLTLGPSAKVTGSFSAATMIVATGIGELRKEFSAIGSFTFPLGDTSGTEEYSPVTITINSATAITSAYVGANLIDAVHPNNSSGMNYLSRFWILSSSGITNPSFNVTFTYTDADINGNEAFLYGGKFNSEWTLLSQVNALSNTFTATGITDFGDFTGGEKSELNLTVLIEGLYNGSTMVPDSVTLELHDTAPPYALAYKTKTVINSSGNGTAVFFALLSVANYYIVIKHRNSIETWSASAQSFNNEVMNYDFTTGSNQALGNNLKYKGTKWCIYSGDTNQDGFIDLYDLVMTDNDVFSSVIGYTATDLNGDSEVNQTDLSIVDSNSLNFIPKIVP